MGSSQLRHNGEMGKQVNAFTGKTQDCEGGTPNFIGCGWDGES